MPEQPKAKAKTNTNKAAVAASTNGNGNERPLNLRYHRRVDVDLSIKIDTPVKDMLDDWGKFVTEKTGIEVTVDMSIEDICTEYLLNHPEFKIWAETNGNKNGSSRTAKAGSVE